MAPIAAALISLLTKAGETAIDKVLPNPEDDKRRDEAKAAFSLAILNAASALDQAAANIILAEANSQSWLARNWRPLLMLDFGVLITLRWLGVTAPNLTADEYLKLWEIVRLGLGGYIIGRSVEKVTPSIATALNRKNNNANGTE